VAITFATAATIIDCRHGMSLTCGVDMAGVATGGAGLAFRLAPKVGKLAAETGELGDAVFGWDSVGFGTMGLGMSLTEGKDGAC
jgi:hypothetical protein